MPKKKEKMPDLCKECIRFKLFGKKCRVFWEGKSFCSRKCYSNEEMQSMDTLF